MWEIYAEYYECKIIKPDEYLEKITMELLPFKGKPLLDQNDFKIMVFVEKVR